MGRNSSLLVFWYGIIDSTSQQRFVIVCRGSKIGRKNIMVDRLLEGIILLVSTSNEWGSIRIMITHNRETMGNLFTDQYNPMG